MGVEWGAPHEAGVPKGHKEISLAMQKGWQGALGTGRKEEETFPEGLNHKTVLGWVCFLNSHHQSDPNALRQEPQIMVSVWKWHT